MRKGDKVDDFTATDDKGASVSLSSYLKDGPVVLFFYPKAMTAGCTMQSCRFRDLAVEFAEVGAQRLGISADSVDRQAEFAEKNDFDYPLLSDRDRKIARQFGVKRPGPLLNKRATFVIDTNFEVIEAIASEIDMNAHADRALSALRNRSG